MKAKDCKRLEKRSPNSPVALSLSLSRAFSNDKALCQEPGITEAGSQLQLFASGAKRPSDVETLPQLQEPLSEVLNRRISDAILAWSLSKVCMGQGLLLLFVHGTHKKMAFFHFACGVSV